MGQSVAVPARERKRVATAADYGYAAVVTLILVAIGWIDLRVAAEARLGAWIATLSLMAAMAVIVGRGITGQWRGILIDGRRKLSLSRLQMLGWSLLVLSALVTAVLSNVEGSPLSPFEIEIPSALWVLMGISTASLVAAPATLSSKSGKEPDQEQLHKTADMLRKQGYNAVDLHNPSVVVSNTDPSGARWGDLLKGEEVGNAETVDLGKMQMFLFTFVFLIGYAGAIAALLQQAGPIVGLPNVDPSMNTLLGISHTGYLASKVVPHSREAPAGQAGGGHGNP